MGYCKEIVIQEQDELLGVTVVYMLTIALM